MGRRHKSTGRNSSPNPDYSDLENEMLGPMAPSPPVALRPPVRVPRLIEDRRNWVPDGHDDVRDVHGRTARIGISPARPPKLRQPVGVNRKSPNLYRSGLFLREALRFEAPRSVTVCLRRKTRREVLFAKSKTGKGSRSRKIRNQWSDVKCR